MVSGYTIKKICYKALRITSNNKIITENSSPSLRHFVSKSHSLTFSYLCTMSSFPMPHALCSLRHALCAMPITTSQVQLNHGNSRASLVDLFVME